MGNKSNIDAELARAVSCPQTLIDLMPGLAKEFQPGTDVASWTAYFCDFDVHPASTTIQ